MKKIRIILTILALLLVSTSAFAKITWSVEVSSNNNSTTYTVKRVASGGETLKAVTIYYRTVGLTAFSGQHFVAKSGPLSFGENEYEQSVTISEKPLNLINDIDLLFRYQTGTDREYIFQITDEGGFPLTNSPYYRKLEYGEGYQYKNDYVSPEIYPLAYFDFKNNVHYLYSDRRNYTSQNVAKFLDVEYTPPTEDVVSKTTHTLYGYVDIDDSWDYSKKAAAVSTESLISSTGASRQYLEQLGYKIHATVCFTMKEKDDGYQYVQIIAANSNVNSPSFYDAVTEPDPNKAKKNKTTFLHNPDKSIYKACFELDTSAVSTLGEQFFPHRYDYHKWDDSNSKTKEEIFRSTGYFYEQKYKADYYDANSGAFVLLPTTKYIITRFDCAGEDNDTWGYKDLFVRMALCDNTAPEILNLNVNANQNPTPIQVSGGVHAPGNNFFISIPFSEIVYIDGSSTKLITNWGDLSYKYGSGTNVLTFEGTINENASGELTITGAYGQFRDANGHNCNFPWTASSTKKLGVSLDKTVDFPITYDLAGGTLETANPSSYNYYSEAITLNNPTRKGYTFSGWTGSNGVTASTTVTIPKNSSGAKYYVANWSPIKYSITYDYGFNQTAVSNKTSYTIETATFTLNNPTRQGHRFEGWTGTGLTAVTKTVTIETGSTGDRSFTANWSPIWEGKGTKEDPWIITTTEGLDSLAKNVNQGRSFYGNYIQLGANITYTHGSGTDENNYTAIGGYHNGAVRKFYGIFDGKGYCVSGIRIHKTGDEEADKYQGLFGAVAGASGSVKNVVLDDAKIYGNTNVGGIAGYGEEKFHIENCLVFNTTVTATGNNGLCGAIISEISSSSGNLTIKYNYYRGCTVGGQTTNIGIGSGDYSTNDGAVEGYTITFGTDISGTPKSIIKHNGSDYYSVGTTISFSYAGELSDGQSAFYFVDGTPIAGNSYTMTAKDVTVSMSIASTNTVMLAGHPSGGRYWATFYGFFNYQLPADASAYKLSSDEELYRVVSNGGILPAFSPVVIVSESSTIQLSYTTTAATIDNTGNILVGALSDVSVSGGLIEGKTPYVLGVYGEFSLLGFYKFSGNSIPANKAYYLK